MMYCTFAVMFIAQAYNIPLSWGQQLTMLLLLMVTSKGHGRRAARLAGDISATLAHFNIPEAGLLLIIGIDQFLDMERRAGHQRAGQQRRHRGGRKWEGQLTTPTSASTMSAPWPRRQSRGPVLRDLRPPGCRVQGGCRNPSSSS